MFSWRQKVSFWAERAVLCLAVLYLFGHSMPRAWKTLNTDFPNYYMAARLVHEGYDTSRMYEWKWIQREKDHRGVDRRVVALLPITPFSTLAVWPIAELPPLTAKHVWIVFNLLLLIPMAWMLRRMTRLSYSRIVLVFALSFPLYRNLLYGQFYILLMLMIVAACWCWLRGWQVAAGALVALAAGCKVFPVLLLVWFFRRRQWRALFAGVVGCAACVGTSVAVYGVAANRTWLKEILPWVTRGEGLGTYMSGTASISEVLHGLLLREPQWNPRPWHPSVMAYALLVPLLQMMVLAPAILLIRRGDERPTDAGRERVLMEWSAIVAAALAVSTIPASYNFVLVVFPVCVMAGIFLSRKQYGWLAALAVTFLGIGYPLPVPAQVPGLAIFMWIPRLWLMLALLAMIYGWLWRDEVKSKAGDREATRSVDWERYAWAAALAASVIVSVITTLHVERAEHTEYAYELPLQDRGFSNAEPQATGSGLRYTVFGFEGYKLATQDGGSEVVDPPADVNGDDLSFANGLGQVWVEEAGSGGSRIVDVSAGRNVVVSDARDPVVSADGKELAFVRDDRGRGRLMERAVDGGAEKALTPREMNVYEAAFLSEDEYAYAAAQDSGWPHIYVKGGTRGSSMQIVDARYPAISPDGRWLAYSHMDDGVWNLWVMDLASGAERRIGNVPCNEVEPSWESDSKTLLYGTDCGRSVWFTAVARRRVVP